MDWLNRVGMLLEFLSFFFAAPEIVTELRDDDGKWLRDLEHRVVERGVKWFAIVLLFGVGIITWYPLAWLSSVVLAERVVEFGERSGIIFTIVGGAVLAITFGVVAEFVWGRLIFDRTREMLQRRMVTPILHNLADDRHIRLRWLKIGVGMFVLGFLLQFIATF